MRLIVISERRVYLNILNTGNSDFYVCPSNSTAGAALQSTVTQPLEKYSYNMVSKDMHLSGACC